MVFQIRRTQTYRLDLYRLGHIYTNNKVAFEVYVILQGSLRAISNGHYFEGKIQSS
jgi:hypothetical protein